MGGVASSCTFVQQNAASSSVALVQAKALRVEPRLHFALSQRVDRPSTLFGMVVERGVVDA